MTDWICFQLCCSSQRPTLFAVILLLKRVTCVLACRGLGLDAADLPQQLDPSQWPALKRKFADIFATVAYRLLCCLIMLQKTLDEWTAIFAGSDACVTPVLTLSDLQRAAGDAPVLQSPPASVAAVASAVAQQYM